jgi:hypothetical protein
MPGNPTIHQHASAGGHAKARRRLTLERVEREFGPLETEADAMRRLDLLGRWSASGLLAGSVASAAVRSVEVWLKGHADQLVRERLKAAEARARELESELGRRPRVVR